jgi:hypothetical protein
MVEKHRSRLQKDLSADLNMDVIEWIKGRQQKYGDTYAVMARLLNVMTRRDTMQDVQPRTLKRWMAYERNGR